MPVSSDEPNLALRDTDPGIRPLMNPDARTISSAVLAPLNTNAKAGGAVSDERHAVFEKNTNEHGKTERELDDFDEEITITPSKAADDGGHVKREPFHKRIAREVVSEAKKLLSGEEDEEDPDGDPETDRLEETIYTLMFTAPYNGLAFYFSAVVFVGVLATILLNIYSIVKLGTKDNLIQVPPGVDLSVAVAQALALVGVVVWQTDVTSALSRFFSGYDVNAKSKIETATRSKWHMANAAQFLIGCGLLVDAFLIVVRSTTINDLLTGMAGLGILSGLDDSVFALVKNAPASSTIGRTAMAAKELQVKQKQHILLRIVMYIVIALGLLVPWGLLNSNQRAGKYVCQKLYIQSGDSYLFQVPLVSGIYELSGSGNVNVNNRVVYFYQLPPGHQKPYVDGVQPPKIQYSSKEKAWTYIVNNAIVAKSLETMSYDVTTTTPAQWLVQNSGFNQFVTIDFFAMACIDCTVKDGGLCGKNGKCKNNNCVCNVGRYGLNCKYGAPYENLALDTRKKDFPLINHGTTPFADKFELLKDDEKKSIEVTYRPVYVHDYAQEGVFDIILYLGRRWMLADYNSFDDRTFTSKSDLVAYLQKDFHPFYSNYTPYFVSSPTDFGTTTDTYTPVDLEWFQTVYLADATPSFKIDLTLNVESVLLDSVCSNSTNPCLNDGLCLRNNKCKCDGDYEGALCEKPKDCNKRDNGCDNRGDCSADGVCTCYDWYYGDLCQFDYGCGPDYYQCQNNGICFSTIAGGFNRTMCNCTFGFTGAYCEYNNSTGKNAFFDATPAPTATVTPTVAPISP